MGSFFMLKLVINAGGKGTRIQQIANNIPKPLIKIANKPVLEHQLNFFSQFGIKSAIITISHLGNLIKEYFGDGSKFDMQIDYIEEHQPLGTAGALKFLKNQFETLLLVNGDILFDFDLQRMLNYHFKKSADITLFTHSNQHPFDSSVIDTDDDGRIIRWLNKEDVRDNYPNRVNAGIHLINHSALNFNSNIWLNDKIDLDRDILKPNILTKKIFAYDSPEYVKDMGTPERFYQVEKDLLNGILHSKNLNLKQKAIFLDRDGTINKYKGFITQPDQIELIDGVAEAIKLINQSEYLAIIVTNQPVIARGECSFNDLKRIHNQLEMLLGEQSAYVDDIIFCPHHTDKGFDGEIPELKFDCNCRKPKPGMLIQMAEKYNINLNDSFMIGDDIRDVEAGINAGCKSIYVGNENLLEAVKLILEV